LTVDRLDTSEECAGALIAAAYLNQGRLRAAIDDLIDSGLAAEVLAVLAESMVVMVGRLEEARIYREAAAIVTAADG
jgi:hypothetical protein